MIVFWIENVVFLIFDSIWNENSPLFLFISLKYKRHFLIFLLVFKSETTIEKTSEKTEEIKKEEGIKSKSNFEIYKYLIGFSLLLFGFFFSAICGFLFFLIFSEDSNTKNDEVPFYFLLPLSLPTFLIILYGNWVATKIFRHS